MIRLFAALMIVVACLVAVPPQAEAACGAGSRAGKVARWVNQHRPHLLRRNRR